MALMTLGSMLAHEKDLLGKGFHVEILETGPHKRSEGRYLCRIGQGQFSEVLAYNNNLRIAKRNAIIQMYDQLNKKRKAK